MCGVAVLFSQGGRIDHKALTQATQVLRHRGPDAAKLWVDPKGHVGLAHARLSIIDLTTGDQPLANEDGTLHAIVNGEFYDFERIRADLEGRGHRFSTRSDSEILLHLYEERGPSCLEELRGEFAFALYDSRNRMLFAGRDRFGIKPLFYASHGGNVALASEAKALFALGVPARWDAESVYQASALVVPLQDRSLFAGIQQVPPGHYLLATPNHLRLVAYWDFDFGVEQTQPGRSASDDIAQLATTIDEAIRLRLRADVPVGVYLSGGLDSCALLGMATKHVRKPIRAFTLSFDRAEYDEAPIAREMAQRAGAEYTELAVGQLDFARDFSDAVWHAETLMNNANGVSKFRLSRAVRDAGYRVVLTGEGSDEIFAGYPHFRRDLFLEQEHEGEQGRLTALEQSNTLSRGLLMPDGQALPLDGVRGALGFVPSWVEAIATTGHKVRGLLRPEFAAQFAEREPAMLLVGSLDVARALRGRPRVHQAMYLWNKIALPNFILSLLGDRMEMAHSVEGRLPFLDHTVVELAMRLPVDLKIRGAVEKYILREVARPFITDTVYRRQKHPFVAPPATCALGGPLHELMQDTLRGPALAGQPFYEPRSVVDLLDTLPQLDDAARAALDPPILSILSACVLQKRFGLGSA